MAGGRQRRLRTAIGMLLTLSLAATGCSSTSGGRTLFGRRDDSGASSSRFVLFSRSGSAPAAGAPGTAVIAVESGEQMVWRPVQRRGDQPGGFGTAANVQVVSAQAGPGNQATT